jgi:superfamily II DNA or RNA helicase
MPLNGENSQTSHQTPDITITPIDEAFVRINADGGTFREIVDYFTFKVPGAEFMPGFRNKIWDGKIRLLNGINKTLPKGLVPYVLKFADSRQYLVDVHQDLIYHDEFSIVEADSHIRKLNLKLEPRDYQLKAFVHAIRTRRALLLSPTASGKSLIAYLISTYYLNHTKGKVLIIVPTVSLVHQMAKDFIDYGMPDMMINGIMAGVDKNAIKPITVSTWQSIHKLPKSWYKHFDCVIGDEAHLFKSKSLTDIMNKMVDVKYRFGLTGTLDGAQTHKLVLEGLFGPVKQVVKTNELIESGSLSPFKIKIITLRYDEEIRKQYCNALYQEEMEFIHAHEKRNKFIRNLALSLKGNTLVLFKLVDKHGKILYNDIQDKAEGARHIFFVHGGTDAETREEIRALTENEKDAIIVASYGTFSTGINIRNLHNIVFASPSKSRIRNLQSIGRGLRKSEKKEQAVLYDIADDLSYKKSKNHSLKHLFLRVKMYKEEQFQYKVYQVDFKDE